MLTNLVSDETHGTKRERALGPHYKALIPFTRAPPWPGHLPKSPPPNTSLWGLGFSMNLGGHRHSIHTTSLLLKTVAGDQILHLSFLSCYLVFSFSDFIPFKNLIFLCSLFNLPFKFCCFILVAFIFLLPFLYTDIYQLTLSVFMWVKGDSDPDNSKLICLP